MTVQKEILCGFLPFSLNSAKKMESVTAQVTTVKRTLRQREAASSQVSKIFYLTYIIVFQMSLPLVVI